MYADQHDSNPVNLPGGGEIAGLGKRFLAFLIDIPVGIAVGLVISMLGWILFPNEMDVAERGSGAGLRAVIITAYFGTCYWLWGQTLGKRLMSLRVASAKDGQRPNAVQAYARAFVMAALAVLWITWWTIPFRKDRRAIHDLIARTVVLRSPP